MPQVRKPGSENVPPLPSSASIRVAPKTLASVLVAHRQFEPRELDVPEVGPDAGLLTVEGAPGAIHVGGLP